jgi:hypothetical protein
MTARRIVSVEVEAALGEVDAHKRDLLFATL